MKTLAWAILAGFAVMFAPGLSMSAPSQVTAEKLKGSLKVHPQNPRYFTDPSGRAILLAGSHTWNNLVDMGTTTFDFEAYLTWLSQYPHNFFRLWTWELLTWNTEGNRETSAQIHRVTPLPWRRIGPDKALDGLPKFDLKAFNEEYFTRLRQRVESAQNHKIYAAVMLFEGWGIQFSPDAWRHHPFHPGNNVNGINGDLNGDGQGLEIHTGQNRDITSIQEAYVRKVIDTINEFDNVLYEISNENHPASTQWQYDMIRFIQGVEKSKPKQHPVGMTFQYKGGSNQILFDSPADWISPNHEGGYRDNPPAADGSKVIVTDTDHLWGIGGNPAWVWKSFMRGLNPIFMDTYDGQVLNKNHDLKWIEPIRQSLGVVLKWSRRLDLASMSPHNDLTSSKYCLAKPGEYLIYQPAQGKPLTVDLPAADYAVIWFNAVTGKEAKPESLNHPGGKRAFNPPSNQETVLHLKQRE